MLESPLVLSSVSGACSTQSKKFTSNNFFVLSIMYNDLSKDWVNTMMLDNVGVKSYEKKSMM